MSFSLTIFEQEQDETAVSLNDISLIDMDTLRGFNTSVMRVYFMVLYLS